MNKPTFRQLALSIAIASLMLTTSMIVQTSTAATVSITQKSITLTAGADGRAFAVINGTYSYNATQRVDYNNPFRLYAINYYNNYTPSNGYQYPGIGPVFESPQAGFNPDSYQPWILRPHIEVPRFMMMRNGSNSFVSPTINLTANFVTIGFGGTTGFGVDGSNIVLASLKVSGEQNKLVALTGLVTGSDVSLEIYYPNNIYYGSETLQAGYFAIPFLANMAGNYAFYFRVPSGVANVELTPKVLDVTSLSMGSIATGELKLPEVIDLTTFVAVDPEPSEIKAVSCSVSAGDGFTVSFTMLEHLSGTSRIACGYFDGTLKDEYGIPMSATLPDGTSVPIQAGASGNVYIVLVGNVISRITYAMGFMPTVIPTAPLNQQFNVDLPLPGGADYQQYKLSVTEDSMVRFNCSGVSSTNLDATIAKISPDGTVYDTTDYDISDGDGPFIPGAAEGSSYISYALYMPAGTHGLMFQGSGSARVEINTYPIEDYTLGSALNLTAHTTKGLRISISNPLEYYAFNVSLTLPQVNRSILYKLSLFDDYHRYLGSIIRDGSGNLLPGIGNKIYAPGGLLGITSNNNYYVDPSGYRRYFFGNDTLQKCLFVPTYAGKYFLVVDCLGCYDTSTAGDATGTRWKNYTGAVPLRIDLSKPVYTDVISGLYEIVYTTLDSRSGANSTSWTFTSTGSPTLRMIGLKLTPQVYTWTRISVTIINGTSGGTTNGSRTTVPRYEMLFDKIRWGTGTNTFNYRNQMTPDLWPDNTFYGVYPTSGRRNTTYIIEFGALQNEMMIRFLVDLYASGTAAHTVVSFNVTHYSTPAFSGLGIPPAALGVSPMIILLIGAVIVAVVVVVAVVALKKRKHGAA